MERRTRHGDRGCGVEGGRPWPLPRPHRRPTGRRRADARPEEGQAPQGASRPSARTRQGGTEVHFGDFGLVALEAAWITNRQIEAARVAITRHIRRGGKVWINIFPDKPVTKKPAETRMGSGKGNPEGWVAVVKPGRVMFELSGSPSSRARRCPVPRTSCRSRASSSPARGRGDGVVATIQELRDLGDEELFERLESDKEELFNPFPARDGAARQPDADQGRPARDRADPHDRPRTRHGAAGR